MSGPARLGDVASLIVGDLRAMVPDAEFVFYVVSPGGEKIVAEYATRAGLLEPGYDTIPLGERVSGWVAANRQQIDQLRRAPRPRSVGRGYAAALLRGDAARGRGCIVGVLTAYADAALPAEAARRLGEIAPQVAQVIAAVAQAEPLRQAKGRLSRSGLRVAASR